MTIDASTFTEFSCGESAYDVAQSFVVGDTCPTEFTLEVENVQALYTTFNSSFSIDVSSADELVEPACSARTIAIPLNVWEINAVPSMSVRSQPAFIDGQICLAGPGVCENTCRYYSTIDTVEAAYAATNGIVKLRFGIYADPNDAPLEVRAWPDDLCMPPQ